MTAKDMLIADDDAKIGDLMETEIISVSTHTDQEEVARALSKYDFLAIPVLDSGDLMVGIVTVDDAMDVMEDEATEDIIKMGGANPSEKYDFLAIPVLDSGDLMVGIVTVDDAMDVMEDEATEDIIKMGGANPSEKSYFETSVFQHAKNRIVWLLVLMLSATFTGIIITHYEDAFAVVPMLVSFIPMLMDTGGNCGSQSSTLIIRGIALDEIHFKDIFKVMFKEFRISIVVGVILAAANGIRIYIMYKDLNLAFVIGCSLIVTIMIAKLIGCILPLLAKKVHLDPAIMAAPLITTIVDTCSIVVYFMIATAVFKL